MLLHRIICLSASLCLFSFNFAEANPGHAINEVEVHFQFEQEEITLHQPVVLTLKVHNSLSKPISLELGREMREFLDFSTKTPEGRLIAGKKKPEEMSEGMFGTGKAEVPPGGNYAHEILLNQWFDFSSPGTYLVTANLTNDIDIAGDGKITPKSQTVRLVVGGRDAARLQDFCNDLAKQIEAWPNIEKIRQQEPSPALKLSYVDDPIAVPYLAQALYAHKQMETDAVGGLERIGNKDATQILISALGEKYGDIATLSRGALSRLESRVTDPTLKQQIHLALAPPRSR
jgi:hypothetical protein